MLLLKPIQISWIDDLLAYFTGTERGSLPRRERNSPFSLLITHLVYPPKFFVTIFFIFFWDDCNTHQK